MRREGSTEESILEHLPRDQARYLKEGSFEASVEHNEFPRGAREAMISIKISGLSMTDESSNQKNPHL